MTAANFTPELAEELLFEGGFVDDPADPGGATDFGITLATLSHWEGRQATLSELTGMSDATKAAIYRSLFWQPIQGDALPSGVDLVVFDMAVNGGPGRAARMLQGCVGAKADGMVGPITLKAVSAVPSASLIASYSHERTLFYQTLPGFARFGDGWLSRVDKCEQKALALVTLAGANP